MPQRSSYLIDRAFRSFLRSTILSSMTAALAIMVDSVIVGRLLGAQPLAALSLCTPVAQVYSALNALLNVGGAAVASLFIGKQRMDKAGGVFAASLCLSLLTGLVWVLVGAFALPSVSGVLTRDAALQPLVEQYLRIMLLSAPLYLLLPGLCAFVRVDNAPRCALFALVVANAANLALDIVFIRFFHMGIAGSSLATACGYVLGMGVAALHFRDKDHTLCAARPDWGETPAILRAGAPIALASVLMMLRVLCTNTMVQRFWGAEAMPLMAVCFNLLMLTSMFAGGVAQSFQPMGGMLMGAEDYRGLGLAAKKAWQTLLPALGALLLAVLCFPGFCLRLFGLSGSAEAFRTVRLFALCIPLYGANYLLMVTHQTLGHTRLSMANACMDSLVVIAMLWVIGMLWPSWLWLAFAVGELCVMLLIAALSRRVQRREDGSALLLLPPADRGSVDFSMLTDLSDLQEGMAAIRAFLEAENAASAVNAVELCCEEMLALLIAASTERAPYADVRLRREEFRLVLSLISAGTRFDPLTQGGDGIGLVLCSAMCSQVRYAYIANQNVVTFFLEPV